MAGRGVGGVAVGPRSGRGHWRGSPTTGSVAPTRSPERDIEGRGVRGLELQALQLHDGGMLDARFELSGDASKTPDDQRTEHASRDFEAACFAAFVPRRAEVHAVEAKSILAFTSGAGDFRVGGA